MKRSAYSRGNLSQRIRLYRELQQERMALDRLTLEFVQNEEFLRWKMADMKNLVSQKLYSTTNKPDVNFLDALFSNIHYRQKILQEHIAFIDKNILHFH